MVIPSLWFQANITHRQAETSSNNSPSQFQTPTTKTTLPKLWAGTQTPPHPQAEAQHPAVPGVDSQQIFPRTQPARRLFAGVSIHEARGVPLPQALPTPPCGHPKWCVYRSVIPGRDGELLEGRSRASNTSVSLRLVAVLRTQWGLSNLCSHSTDIHHPVVEMTTDKMNVR